MSVGEMAIIALVALAVYGFSSIVAVGVLKGDGSGALSRSRASKIPAWAVALLGPFFLFGMLNLLLWLMIFNLSVDPIE